MDTDRSANSICVLGGGSAGYIAALYLKKRFPDKTITLIESARIPVIGVGEASTPPLLDFLHRVMGFPVQEFFQETKPTIKLGVKKVWGRPGSEINNPFGPTDVYNAIYHTGDANNSSFTAILMAKFKAPFVVAKGEPQAINLPRGYAYHIDNEHFLGYLKAKILASGCEIVAADIEACETTPDGLSIHRVVATNGRHYNFDLYIDCSGFSSLLIGKTLQTPWVDYSASLKTNRAIVGTRDNLDEIAPYTTATSLRHGWLWNTPMQRGDHLGYVFSRDHCSDDEAFAELKKHCAAINGERVVAFRSGRHARSWVGNVVAIGNAFAFIEPLESTGIHMILRQLRKLAHGLRQGQSTPSVQAEYNDWVNSRWDQLKWFIALHFKYNRQIDSPFWTECQNEVDISGLDDYVDYFMSKGPLSYAQDLSLFSEMAEDPIFPVFAYDSLMIGCGFNLEFFKRRSDRVSTTWPMRFRLDQALADRAIGHRAALVAVEEGRCAFKAAEEARM